MKDGKNRHDESRSLSLHLTAFWPGIPYLGWGVWLAWQLLMFSGGSWISDENDSLNISEWNMRLCLITALVLLLAPFFRPYVEKILASKSLILGLGLFGTLGGLLLIIAGPYYTGMIWIARIALVLNSIASAFIIMKSGQIFGELPPHKILVYALLSLLLASSIFFFVLGSNFFVLIPGGPPLIGTLALFVLAPLAAWLTLMKTDTKPEEATRATHSTSKESPKVLPAAFWKLIIAVLIFTLATSSIRSLYVTPQLPLATQVDSNIVVFLLAVFALTMLIVALRYLRNVNFARIYLITAVLIAAILVITPLLPVESGFISVIAGLSASVLDFMIWCLLAFIVSEKRFSAITVFGYGRGIAFAGSGFGWVLGIYVIPGWQDTTFGTIFDILLALLVIASAVFLFTEKDYDSLFASISKQKLDLDEYVAETNGKAGKKRDQGRPWLEACRHVGGKVRLTEREQQVLEQISLGRSQKFIARRLTISHNTVRTHTGNIYAKLDVHSREQLIEMIEAEYDNLAG